MYRAYEAGWNAKSVRCGGEILPVNSVQCFFRICALEDQRNLDVNGQNHLEVTQPEMVKAQTGESANITCSFMSATPSYFVTWTLGCNNSALQLKDHPCFQSRIMVSSPETPNNPQEKKTMLTILNLTESDSGKFCCHVRTADKDTGSGQGTRLEIAPRSSSDEHKIQEMRLTLYILCAVIGAEACVIIILIILVVRFCSRGSSRSENQNPPLDPSGLHYAEICNNSFPKQSRPRTNTEGITYSAVKVKTQDHRKHRKHQEYGL
ncbi:uncharacterized protein LOC142185559 [Leptodactylus fuscus]|uniref:uncharacterized protein LOC142185559 n=1 Tax=Leptodactylus fuscus TaxID=238119 RepID=UPI003F4F3E10